MRQFYNVTLSKTVPPVVIELTTVAFIVRSRVVLIYPLSNETF